MLIQCLVADIVIKSLSLFLRTLIQNCFKSWRNYSRAALRYVSQADGRSECHTISLLSLISRLVESIINKKFVEKLNKNKLLSVRITFSLAPPAQTLATRIPATRRTHGGEAIPIFFVFL